jgi:hypothetical protein
MSFLIVMKTFFSTVAGGGARGRGDGIVPMIIVQVGATIRMSPLFTGMCQRVGGMTIAGIVGKGVNGNTVPSPMNRLKRIGIGGKRTGTGRKKITGVSMT